MNDKEKKINRTESISLYKKIKYTIEYIPLSLTIWILSVLPSRFGIIIGRSLGRIIGGLLVSRYRIAKDNISKSLPNIPENKINKIVGNCWASLGQSIVEFSKIQKISKEEYFSLVETEGLESVEKAYRLGQGILLITAHYSAWEIAGQLLPFSGYKTAVVARRIKNPYVNDLVNRIRETNGIRVILSRNAVRESIRWLKEGNILVLLIDHRITEGGLDIPFFERPASTTSLPAILALRYNIPTFPVRCLRKNGKIKISFDPQMNFSGLTPKEEDIYKATLEMNKILENWIREFPEMWLWIHNRWKT